MDVLTSLPIYYKVLLGLGAISAIKIAFSLLSALSFVFGSGLNVKKLGKWAVVTGATDGIGLGYVKELARKGFNVVLISRTESKLKDVQNELSQKFKNVEFRIIAADLTSSSEEMFQKIEDNLKDLEIGVLVNNAGVSYDHAEYLTDVPTSQLTNLIQINVVSLTRITKIVLPSMVARRRGAILNIGSAAGYMPIGDPLYSVYSASKAYVDFFSRSLNLELKSKGVHVECVIPYFVTSKMSKIRKPSLTVPTAETFARASLGRLGKYATVLPYVPHAFQHFIFESLPTWVLSKFVLDHHLSIRKRALAKKNK